VVLQLFGGNKLPGSFPRYQNNDFCRIYQQPVDYLPNYREMQIDDITQLAMRLFALLPLAGKQGKTKNTTMNSLFALCS
jgi:hypothetical protein